MPGWVSKDFPMDRERISSLVWLLVSLGIVAGSSFYAYGSWSQPGPAFLPLWCGMIMGVLSLIMIIQTMWRKKIEEKGKKEGSFFTPRWSKVFIILLILLAFAFLLEPCGYIPITFVSMFALLKVVGTTKWKTALMEATFATMISYTLFEIWLNVPLPRGFLSGLF
jgi:putative tricarboxylic transport membrane protein